MARILSPQTQNILDFIRSDRYIKCREVDFDEIIYSDCGYTVDNNGNLIRLYVDFIPSDLPDEFWQIRTLRKLGFSGDEEKKEIPFKKLPLPNLEALELENFSSVSEEFALSIRHLKSLRLVATDFPYHKLKEFSGLKHLEISHSPVKFNLLYIRALPLQSLIIKNTDFDDEPGFPETLEKLILENVAMPYPSVLARLRNLRELRIRDTVVMSLAFLRYLKRLEILDISSSQVFTLKGLRFAGNLKMLFAHHCNIRNADEVGELKDLFYLRLEKNPIQNAAFLNKLPKLRNLITTGWQIKFDKRLSDIELLAYLSQETETFFTRVKLKALFQNPDARFYGEKPEDYYHIITSGNRFTTDSKGHLTGLRTNRGIIDIEKFNHIIRNVKYLYLTPLDYELEGLKSEATVWLKFEQSRQSDFLWIKGFPNLRHLDIENTDITDLEPAAGLKNLRVLNIRNTNIFDLEPLKNFSKLRALFLNEKYYFNVNVLLQLSDLKLVITDKDIYRGGEIKKLVQRLNTYTTDDRVYLTALKNDLGNPFFYESDWSFSPREGVNALRWDNDRITGITLIGEQRTKLPDYLFYLKAVNALSLRDFNVTSKELEKLVQLPELKILYIGGNEVLKSLDFLRVLPDLEELHILYPSVVEDLSALSELKKLKILSIHTTAKTELDFSPVSNLTSLNELEILCQRQNFDISYLLGIRELSVLELAKCNILNKELLVKLTSISDLSLINCRIDDVRFLKNATHLERLNLSYNLIRNPMPLKKLRILEYLDLTANKIRSPLLLMKLKRQIYARIYAGDNPLRKCGLLFFKSKYEFDGLDDFIRWLKQDF